MTPATDVSIKKSSPKTTNFRLFERCSGGLLNLGFDSSVLESYYILCSFPHSLFRFRIAVGYFALVCVTWMLFFDIARTDRWIIYISGASAGVVVSLILFGLTCSKIIFEKHFLWLYIFVSLAFSILFLMPFQMSPVGVSAAFNLSIIIQFLIVIYTNIPLRLWQAMLICCPVSIIHIALSCFASGTINPRLICIFIVVHFCVHMVGFLQHLLSQIQRRSTFMRLGHSALMRKALEKEQQTRTEMIQSLMPQQVAQEVMRDVGKASTNEEEEPEEVAAGMGHTNDVKMNSIGTENANKVKKQEVDEYKLSESDDDDDGDDELEVTIRPQTVKESDIVGLAGAAETNGKGTETREENLSLTSSATTIKGSRSASMGQVVRFRKFHVNQMENVSILFADIVGFTKMSSNKSASHLVYLLNDLFGRFDSLCNLTQCEKIATLGDCYYCVSGCPNSVEDHAERIVEMGRSMCVAIQQFDEDHSEQVNMRVGVHTGKVICGIVGTRRFKFDVWSNDVTLANKMESSGEAGKVHISETTLEFVDKIYKVSEGEPVPDIRKVKVLIEYFNKDKQSYAIKHTQDEALIKTYFVEKRFDEKPVIELERIAPSVEHDCTNNRLERSVGDQSTIPFLPVDTSKKLDSLIMTTASNELTLTTTTPSTSTAVVIGVKPEVKCRGSDVEMLDALWNLSKPEEVFKFPPISPFSLCFLSAPLEQTYRLQIFRIPKRYKLLTLATPRLSPAVNGIAHFVIFSLVLIACCVNFPNLYDLSKTMVTPSVVISVAFIIVFFFLVVVLVDIIAWRGLSIAMRQKSAWRCIFFKLYWGMFNWTTRNIYGALLIATPAACILSNFQLCMFWANEGGVLVTMGEYRIVYGLLCSMMLFGFTLFPNLSSWTKSLSATFIAIITIVLMHWPFTEPSCQDAVAALPLEPLTPVWLSAAESKLFPWEMTIIILLNLILVYSLNRDIDISFRVNFNRDFEASCAKKAISREKMQGEWLLENIIPRYVLTDLRRTNKYSQHVKDAGVMFASIANFSEFYDEQYQGGQEMLRVLNEIFADFEQKLSLSRFKDVEKIKTIGECFMASSGLNIVQRSKNRRPDTHLFALIDFAIELIKTLEEFNQQMFSFRFELKIGFNIGEVTAGVIGTTKLLYDIWGDTVNVASRMYSTGQKARIQVTEDVAQRLSSRYDFEYRGNVSVKGKGEMRTYLLVGRKQSTKQPTIMT